MMMVTKIIIVNDDYIDELIKYTNVYVDMKLQKMYLLLST